MKRFFWTFSISLFILFVAFFWITFRPISNVGPGDVIPISGKATAIYEGSGYDIYIAIENIERPFYINRGLQLGLNLDSLNEQVLNKTVTLHCINRWTPFTTDGIHPHISKLQLDEQVIFNEINEQ